ncbi:MAG: hypothetical protein R3B52_03060 [Candidatus Paceibacterota bacterium]
MRFMIAMLVLTGLLAGIGLSATGIIDITSEATASPSPGGGPNPISPIPPPDFVTPDGSEGSHPVDFDESIPGYIIHSPGGQGEMFWDPGGNHPSPCPEDGFLSGHWHAEGPGTSYRLCVTWFDDGTYVIEKVIFQMVPLPATPIATVVVETGTYGNSP